MSRKSIFIENLIKNRSEIEEDIIFFSQNTKKLFENRIFSEEESSVVLNNLIKYLPCSRKIIDEYLIERYGYPKNADGSLFNLIREGINKEKMTYKKLVEEIFNEPSSRVCKRYDKEVNEFNVRLSAKFKDSLDLKKRNKILLKNCEDLRLKNLPLEEIDKEAVKKETQKLNSIKKSLLDSEKVIQSLKKLV